MATGAVEASLVVTPVGACCASPLQLRRPSQNNGRAPSLAPSLARRPPPAPPPAHRAPRRAATETLKTRLIHDQNSAKPKYRGLIHAARVIGAEEGLGGIYKGWTPTMAKQMGNQGVRFLVFEEIKKAFASGDGAPMAFWGKFLSGGTAGLVSVLATMPFDMVKTRMQGLEAAQYRSTLHCVQKVFAEEGLFAFWKGMAPRLPRVVFGQSITLSSYDTIVDILVGRGR